MALYSGAVQEQFRVGLEAECEDNVFFRNFLIALQE